MSRFLRLKECVAPFMAAATLIAPTRGNYTDPLWEERAKRSRNSGPIQRNPNQEFPTNKPSELERRNKLYEDSKVLIDLYCDKHKIRGIAVCVSLSGQQKMLYSTGIQDENLQVKATPDLVGNISFLSKTFLMYVLLKLAAILHIDINSPIQDVLVTVDPMPVATPLVEGTLGFDKADTQSIIFPLFDYGTPQDRELEYNTVKEQELNAANWRKGEVRYLVSSQLETMTIEQIMYECSGIIQCLRWSVKNTKDFVPLQDKVALIANAPLMYKPGAMPYRTGIVQYPGWDLCSFELLAYLIESLSQRSYQDVMKDELLKLGLRNTTFQDPDKLYLNKTRGSQNECKPDQFGHYNPKNATWVNYASHVGSEGLCSTVKDLDKFFNIMHLNFMTLNPAHQDSLNRMLESRAGAASTLHDYDDLGRVRRGFGKAVISEAELQETCDLDGYEVYNQSLIYQNGEAREGSSIAMIITQVDPDARPKFFSAEEKEELCRMRQTPFCKTDYEGRKMSDLLTRESNSNTPPCGADLRKYVTVSIMSTSRDKDLYVLGRKLGKLTFEVYNVENEPNLVANS